MARRQTIDPLIRAEVINRWGNTCWLSLPGCTKHGEEDDHVRPFHIGGLDTVANIRRACKHCNASRQDRILSGYGANIHVVLGPPEAGKTTFVAEHATSDALVLDFDRLAGCICPDVDIRKERPAPLVAAAQSAWQGAYRRLVRLGDPVDVWLIKSIPSNKRHPRMLDEWIALDYSLHVVDPGAQTVFDRLTEHDRTHGEQTVARQWYALRITQQLVDAKQKARRDELARLGLRSSPPSTSVRPEW